MAQGPAVNKKILIIDDDQQMAGELSEALRDRGYLVDTVSDGKQGLDLSGKGSYDVVLLDLKMPGISGFEVLARIKGMRPETKVIVLTGSLTGEDAPIQEYLLDKEEQARQKNILNLADSLLRKPFNIETLLSAINKIIA